jgi:hypothetical protein
MFSGELLLNLNTEFKNKRKLLIDVFPFKMPNALRGETA